MNDKSNEKKAGKQHLRTSIGRSPHSRPKHKRADRKKYRGQGK